MSIKSFRYLAFVQSDFLVMKIQPNECYRLPYNLRQDYIEAQKNYTDILKLKHDEL
jgi:hypothetical protein